MSRMANGAVVAVAVAVVADAVVAAAMKRRRVPKRLPSLKPQQSRLGPSSRPPRKLPRSLGVVGAAVVGARTPPPPSKARP